MASGKIYEFAAEEIYQSDKNNCCYLPLLSAIIRGGAELIFTKTGFALEFQSQDKRFIDFVSDILKKVTGSIYKVEKNYIDKVYVKGNFYSLYVPSEDGAALLERTAIVKDKINILDDIPKNFIKNNCCRVAYICGLFVSCGTLVTPDAVSLDGRGKTKSGYHLEFAVSSETIRDEVKEILEKAAGIGSLDIHYRKNGGLYIKNADSIGDILAAMGCKKSYFMLQDIITSREFKNRLNRVNNATLANIDKVVSAGEKQLAAIELIKNTIGLDTLPPALKEYCYLRLNNESATLLEIAQMCDEPTTKSGINHRMRKIIKIAEEISEKQKEK